MSRALLTLSISALFLGGCAGPTSQAYVAPKLALNGGYSDILAAVEYNARDQGWRVVESDEQTGQVTALSPVSRLGGLPSRERWTFKIDGNAVRATLVFETRFDERPSAPWRPSGRTPAGYQYVREKAQLERIAGLLDSTEVAMK